MKYVNFAHKKTAVNLVKIKSEKHKIPKLTQLFLKSSHFSWLCFVFSIIKNYQKILKISTPLKNGGQTAQTRPPKKRCGAFANGAD